MTCVQVRHLLWTLCSSIIKLCCGSSFVVYHGNLTNLSEDRVCLIRCYIFVSVGWLIYKQAIPAWTTWQNIQVTCVISIPDVCKYPAVKRQLITRNTNKIKKKNYSFLSIFGHVQNMIQSMWSIIQCSWTISCIKIPCYFMDVTLLLLLLLFLPVLTFFLFELIKKRYRGSLVAWVIFIHIYFFQNYITLGEFEKILRQIYISLVTERLDMNK